MGNRLLTSTSRGFGLGENEKQRQARDSLAPTREASMSHATQDLRALYSGLGFEKIRGGCSPGRTPLQLLPILITCSLILDLPIEFQPKLNLAGLVRLATYLAEGRRKVKASIRCAIYGPVQEVKELGPELNVYGFIDIGSLEKCQVLVIEGETSDIENSRRIPELESTRLSKGRRVKVNVSRRIKFPTLEGYLRCAEVHIGPVTTSVEEREAAAAGNC